MIVSCQKDETAKADPLTKADSTLNAPDNYLATGGTLIITIMDSTYRFDAGKDSIAFVNVHSGDSSYFGITAINKAHTMSFGISSAGHALSSINTVVAGSQFLLKPQNDKPALQFALTDHAIANDFGRIYMTTYKQDSLLAKGTFYTYLVKGDVLKSPAAKVKGVFNLMLK